MAHKILTLTIGALTGMALTAAAAGKPDLSKIPPASTKKGVTYDKDIKAIFDASCFKCHGAEKQKGKLRLDSLAAALKGGENGKSILPGKSAESPLVQSVARLVEDDAMPPADKGKPLTKEQIGLIRAWIDQGAK
ncbi:hypothetical protein LBMAG56_36810 [Verrucomicrobiota bacterium]|nr:hypothetical protein LBMAG56_36810 [Verrucomicrobiota bacterium]